MASRKRGLGQGRQHTLRAGGRGCHLKAHVVVHGQTIIGAAFGTIPSEVPAAACQKRWLQAPQVTPPAGSTIPSSTPIRWW
jgi:hypothetical protein